jgi:CheY-like chemotaxis protein/anti-sigma regulatory factor (Ser/Thr protein kinase)
MTSNSVLIAEDDAAARKGLAQLVTHAGFRVATAADGFEALERVDQDPPDLMLLDMWMPKMDGLEVLRRLRERPARPKVIIMTADDTPETVLLSLRGDAYQFIAKPIQPSALLALLKDTLQAPTEIPPIVVLSARPGWVELLVPCAQAVADRIEGFIATLETDLPDDVRRSMAVVFRELLSDAMQGDGQFDPNHRVRIACLRSSRLLMYRIADAGYGFRASDASKSGAQTGRTSDASSNVAHNLLRPGLVLARELADEVLVNEPGDEVLVVKYLT